MQLANLVASTFYLCLLDATLSSAADRLCKQFAVPKQAKHYVGSDLEPNCSRLSVYAQSGLGLCWSHIPHYWKSHVAAHFTLNQTLARQILIDGSLKSI